jgi:HAD superfamily hydrolase (TIGR01549 family)
MIDTVLFDLDDTLHDDSAAFSTAARMVADEIAGEHGIDPAVLTKAYIAEAQAFWRALSAAHLAAGIIDTRGQMWADALAASGMARAAADTLAARCAERYTRYRAEVLQPFPGAVELVDELRRRGCKLGIVTNGFAATHHDKIARLGFTERFDALFIADEMGMVKPDPRVFAHACAVLDSEPQRTAMVGDRYDRDITGAHEAGLFTVLVDVHRIPIPAGARPPDAVVATIAEVLAVLPLATATGATLRGANTAR